MKEFGDRERRRKRELVRNKSRDIAAIMLTELSFYVRCEENITLTTFAFQCLSNYVITLTNTLPGYTIGNAK